MPSYYHKGGTDVGVCPVPTIHSTLKFVHACTATHYKRKKAHFYQQEYGHAV